MAQSPRAVDWAIMHPELPETDPPSPQGGGTDGRLDSNSPPAMPPSFAVPPGRELRPTVENLPPRGTQLPSRMGNRTVQSARTRRVGRALLEIVAVVVIAAILALGLRAFVVQVYKIPSESMMDTLNVGSRIAVNSVPGWGKQVERGDIVVFRDSEGWLDPVDQTTNSVWSTVAGWFGFAPQGSEQIVVKRVIGVGGDTVTCCDDLGRLSVNGVAIDEPYLAEGAVPSTTPFSVVVPEGSYWMMGDNRQRSADSQYHLENGQNPFIPEGSVIGRAQWEIWPLSDWSYLGNRDVFTSVPDPQDAS